MRFLALGISLVCFGASLCFNTILFSPGDSSFLLGIVCLLLGWSSIQWFANPCFVMSAIRLKQKRYVAAAVWSSVATALALSTFSLREIVANEAGQKSPIVGYGPGFYLWLVSIVTILIGAIACMILQKVDSTLTESTAQ
jgi:hypothetical protein